MKNTRNTRSLTSYEKSTEFYFVRVFTGIDRFTNASRVFFFYPTIYLGRFRIELSTHHATLSFHDLISHAMEEELHAVLSGGEKCVAQPGDLALSRAPFDDIAFSDSLRGSHDRSTPYFCRTRDTHLSYKHLSLPFLLPSRTTTSFRRPLSPSSDPSNSRSR